MKIIRNWSAGIFFGKQCLNLMFEKVSSIYLWYQKSLEVVRYVMAKNEIIFKGKGVSIEDIVQIDESMFGKTQK